MLANVAKIKIVLRFFNWNSHALMIIAITPKELNKNIYHTPSEEDKAKVEEAVKKAKEELNSNDNDRIVKATEELSNEVQGVFAKLYQQANPNGDPNAQGGANGGEEFHQ